MATILLETNAQIARMRKDAAADSERYANS